MHTHIELSNKPLMVEQGIAYCQDAELGAMSIFIGNVRKHDLDQSVSHIDYEIDHDLAKASIEDICSRAHKRFGSLRHFVAHRYGQVAIGESAIIIITASVKRVATMEASRFMLERIKEETPVWKHQIYQNGSDERIGYHRIPLQATTKSAPSSKPSIR